MRKEDRFLEELFTELYGEDTFEGALDEFNSEFEGEEEFEGYDEEFDGWLKTHKGDDTLLCWLWDVDCGPSGPEGFCDEVRSRFGEVTLKTVRLHAEDLKSDLEN